MPQPQKLPRPAYFLPISVSSSVALSFHVVDDCNVLKWQGQQAIIFFLQIYVISDLSDRTNPMHHAGILVSSSPTAVSPLRSLVYIVFGYNMPSKDDFPNTDNIHDHSLCVGAITVTVLATCAVGARFAARRIKGLMCKWDDWSCLSMV